MIDPSRREALYALGHGLVAFALVPATSLAQPAAKPADKGDLDKEGLPASAGQGPVFSLDLVPQRVSLAPSAPPSTLFGFAPSLEGERATGASANPPPHAPASPANAQAIRFEHHFDFPVVHGVEGKPFTLRLRNLLGQPTALCLRGARGQAGHPTGVIAPGAWGDLPIPATQSGAFVLAPDLAAYAPEQRARGLMAAVLIAEADPVLVEHDLVLAIGDRLSGTEGTLDEAFEARLNMARLGRIGNTLLAGNRPAPQALSVRPGARIRLRLINTSGARVMPLRTNGFTATVYAVESTPCTPFDPLKRIVALAPLSRLDLILEAPMEAGAKGSLEIRLGKGVPILSLETQGAALPRRAKAPPFPDPGLPPAIRLQNARRADCVISGGTADFTADEANLRAAFPDKSRIFAINGVFAEPHHGKAAQKPLLRVRKGEVVVLRCHNRSHVPQTLALQGHAFRLLHPYDDGWEPYFLDTLYLPPGAQSHIAFQAEHVGVWPLRSAIPEHYAGGVATHYEVSA